jgi:hypothetical protein
MVCEGSTFYSDEIHTPNVQNKFGSILVRDDDAFDLRKKAHVHRHTVNVTVPGGGHTLVEVTRHRLYLRMCRVGDCIPAAAAASIARRSTATS